MALSEFARSGFQRVLAPVVDFLIRRGVSPNAITTFGTIATIIGGGIYARGHIHLAGWVVGLSAFCDLLDGSVARRSGRTSVFGAFYDSTLDRIADGAVLGGLALFFARNGVHHAIPDYMSTPMVSVLLLGILGSFLTSYTRARAEGLGIDAQVGMLPRPERIVLLSAPQAFFGLAFGGWVLMSICVLLTVTAWITVVQRVAFVRRVTAAQESQQPSGVLQTTPRSTADAFDTRGRRIDRVALAGDRMVLSADDVETRLADVVTPGDATVRRPEAGRPSGFDRAR
ncbi:MAG TPA: CDP-alcohol phosphatidyltransferase family protein [Gemmatimonadaceae bacterium]